MIATGQNHVKTLQFALALLLLTLGGTLQAAVSLTADRNPVRVNESFTLTIQLDGQETDEPELAPLTSVLDVLGTSQETRTTIVNRQIQSVTSWHVSVMARDSGKLVIAPVKVGKQQTNALEITVQAADSGPRSEQDIYLEVDAQPRSPYVQQQVIYTIRLVSAVVTADERLSEPRLLTGEAVIEQIGDRKIFTVQRGNRTLRVIESSYAIFPQKSGPLELDKIQALVRIFDTSSGQWSLLSRRPSEFRLDGDALTLQVRPLPSSYPPSHWLPAKRMQLDEGITDGPYRVGEPFTRSVRLLAQGLTSGQLPEIPLPVPAGLKAYPDRPVFADQGGPDGLSASREQRTAYIPSAAGELVIPALRIPWWNTTEDRLEYVELPRRVLTILPSSQTDELPGNAQTDNTSAALTMHDGAPIWKVTTALALLAWLITLFAWTKGKTGYFDRVRKPATPKAESRRALLKALRAACEAGEPRAARDSLLRYLKSDFPGLNPAQALDRLEKKRPGLLQEINDLDRVIFGPAGETATGWRGDQLWLLLCEALEQEGSGETSGGLTALYPD
ncbi:MAG: BatD family protein [Gammaproteobacteria bacterium]|nr:BatD family protein [Gammaproteobacteria bacterium]